MQKFEHKPCPARSFNYSFTSSPAHKHEPKQCSTIIIHYCISHPHMNVSEYDCISLSILVRYNETKSVRSYFFQKIMFFSSFAMNILGLCFVYTLRPCVFSFSLWLFIPLIFSLCQLEAFISPTSNTHP